MNEVNSNWLAKATAVMREKERTEAEKQARKIEQMNRQLAAVLRTILGEDAEEIISAGIKDGKVEHAGYVFSGRMNQCSDAFYLSGVCPPELREFNWRNGEERDTFNGMWCQTIEDVGQALAEIEQRHQAAMAAREQAEAKKAAKKSLLPYRVYSSVMNLRSMANRIEAMGRLDALDAQERFAVAAIDWCYQGDSADDEDEEE